MPEQNHHESHDEARREQHRRDEPRRRVRDQRARYWRIRIAVELVKGAAWLVWLVIHTVPPI